MRNTTRDFILIALWALIINLSYYYGYTLDHWSSLIFLLIAGGSIGYLIGFKFAQ